MKPSIADMPIMDILVADIAQWLAMFGCMRPNEEKVRRLLESKGINGPWEFGRYYDFKDPYGKFRNDYFKEVMKP